MADYPFVTNAIIERADIRFDRGFILTVWLGLKFDGTGQVFGGYSLGGSPFDKTAKVAEHERQTNIAADFIGGCMAVADVESWKDLQGKIIRVGKDDEWGTILAIGHAVKDRWYEPKARMEMLTAEREKRNA